MQPTLATPGHCPYPRPRPRPPRWRSPPSTARPPCSTTRCAPTSGPPRTPGSQGLEVDDELLYVAAVLHDLGLVAPFDSHRIEFEHAGGHVAWVFAAAAGWPVPRRRRVAEVIVAHMADAVDPDVDPEGHALEAATAFDISGRDIGIPAALQAEVLAAHPRAGLAAEFTACFADQAARKPTGAAAAAVRSRHRPADRRQPAGPAPPSPSRDVSAETPCVTTAVGSLRPSTA